MTTRSTRKCQRLFQCSEAVGFWYLFYQYLLKERWEKHPCPIHISNVTFPETIYHPAFLVFGEKVIQKEHDRKQSECQESGPHDSQSQSCQSKTKILRMANKNIKSFRGDPFFNKLADVNLYSANEKYQYSATKNTDPNIRITVNASFGGTTM